MGGFPNWISPQTCSNCCLKLDLIWKFPKIGVHLNHPFRWDFPLTTIHLGGTPNFWKPSFQGNLILARALNSPYQAEHQRNWKDFGLIQQPWFDCHVLSGANTLYKSGHSCPNPIASFGMILTQWLDSYLNGTFCSKEMSACQCTSPKSP